jgi:transposase
MFVGWDWASTTHDVTVIDDAGNIVDRWAPEHTETGLDQTLTRLAGHGRPKELPVAIERPSGLVVDRLLAAGHPVIPIHPNAFHAARPRWSAARAKSDPGDSFKLADYLRTDGHRLRPLRPLDAATRELQALSRLRDDHVAAKTAASNQLGALLDAHWPGAKQIFSRLGSQIALAFLDAYPTPESAARLGQARLAGFCRRHSYRGGRSPAELLGRLRSAPAAPVGLAPEVLAELVGAQVRLLRILLATIAELDRALGAGLLGHAKAGLLAPLPRIGQVSLAQVVAESARSWTAPAPSSTHGRVRRGTSHQSVRQEQGGHLPVGGQHQGPQRPCHLRQQLPAQLTVGGQGLRRRPPPRQAPSPRRPYPRSGLAAGHVGLLAQRHDLRPRQARR